MWRVEKMITGMLNLELDDKSTTASSASRDTIILPEIGTAHGRLNEYSVSCSTQLPSAIAVIALPMRLTRHSTSRVILVTLATAREATSMSLRR